MVGMVPNYGSVEEDGVKAEESSPLLSASPVTRTPFSGLVFGWFTPLLHRGNENHKLDPDDLDLIPLPDSCGTDRVRTTFERYWNQELEQPHPSLWKALLRAFGFDFLKAGALKLVHDMCVFVGPQVLHAVVEFLRTPEAPLSLGLGYTLLVTLSQLTMSLCLRHYFFQCYTTGLQVRTAVVVAVYQQALAAADPEGSTANLVATDAQRLQDLTTYLHALWYSPFQIGLALYFLWQQLGVSSLGGVAVIGIMIPVTKFVAGWMGQQQKKLMQAKDARVQLNSEVLANMKVVKLQAWEEPYQERIEGLRDAELRKLLEYMVGVSCSRMLWNFTPLLVAVSTFAVYVALGNVLDVASALTALALFDILRFPLFMMPQVINNVVEAMVSLKRIQTFLLAQRHHAIGPGSLDGIGIELEGLSATYAKPPTTDEDPATRELLESQWQVKLLQNQLEEAEEQIRLLSNSSSEEGVLHSSSNLLCLKRINFQCGPGEFIAVVGGVGCGKSSFLNALLGEVRALTGTAAVRGNLAYFSQTPFILNSTVRDNILFGHVGEEVDEELYQRAIQCCSLTHDLELLSDGDRTEIGEKGITLSGGQKARIALARAVYHQADITLIDDALAAVDAHVAKELFENAIVGELLKNKRTVILVTNALQYLNHPLVDRIVVVREGRVVEHGSYGDLARQEGSVFARFLRVMNETGVSGSLSEACEPEEVEAIRRSSVKVEEEPAEVKPTHKKLMTEEARQVGHVSLGVYMSWVKAAGGLIAPIVIVLSFSATEGINILSNWWITYWSEHGTVETQSSYLGIYAIINVVAAVAGLFRMVLAVFFGLRASRKVRFSIVTT